MGNKLQIAPNLSSLTTNDRMSRRKNVSIIFGIVIIITIIVPTTIVLTSRKMSSTTTERKLTEYSEPQMASSATTLITSPETPAAITTNTSEDNVTQSINSSCMVNAWIFLNEDRPVSTNYKNSTSSFQRLIQNNVYQSVNILFICFVSTTATSSGTTPVGDGSSYTIEIIPMSHSSGLTNQDYMDYVISDARRNNPNIRIVVTLDWGNGNLISDIFSTSNYSSHEAAQQFAANLMVYLRKHDLDGFDIDWEDPISRTTTKEQFTLLINAIGVQFKQQTNKHYYLTLSPAEVGNLDATAVNNHMDFINLQLYSGFTYPDSFESASVNPNIFAYGAKFESEYQTAEQAYHDNKARTRYNIFTCWRLNSDNYIFEQTQQQRLHKLCQDTHF